VQLLRDGYVAVAGREALEYLEFPCFQTGQWVGARCLIRRGGTYGPGGLRGGGLGQFQGKRQLGRHPPAGYGVQFEGAPLSLDPLGDLAGAEIATAMVISHETVKTYVSRILAKLDLRDRVQAVVFAHRIGLVTADG
jgi:hypothetical protein